MSRAGQDNQQSAGGKSVARPVVARQGDRLGEWVLESRVGAGTFGEVWKARHHVWGDDNVAVKIPTDSQYLRALRREGITAHHLDHPAIVRPIGFDPFAQRPYLVMEFVDGDDLRTYLQKHGKLSVAETVDILGRVLQGLSYAHGRGVLHRDVKPENVLLHHSWAFDPAAADEPGLVKLTDFGLGKAESSVLQNKAGGSIVFSNDEHTASQAITGSLDYMAPEQRGGGAVDHRADLYACGVMLFELLTGERPAGTDLPSDLVQGVPAHIDEAFRRSYARIDRRFGTAAEFLGALRVPQTPQQIGVAAAPRREFHPDGLSVAPPVVPVPPVSPGDKQHVHQLKLVRGSSCPSCSGNVDGDDQFCMHCGKQLVGTVCRCGRCGAFPSPSDKFCMFCGHDIRPKPMDMQA